MARPKKVQLPEPKKYLGRGAFGDPMITNGCSGCGKISGHTPSCPNNGKTPAPTYNPFYPNGQS